MIQNRNSGNPIGYSVKGDVMDLYKVKNVCLFTGLIIAVIWWIMLCLYIINSIHNAVPNIVNFIMSRGF